jgi:hypothetical protein
VAKDAVIQARGGATYVLHMPAEWQPKRIKHMNDDGWGVHCVQNWEDIVQFAREFSRARWMKDEKAKVAR